MAFSKKIESKVLSYIARLEADGLERVHRNLITAPGEWPLVKDSKTGNMVLNWCSNSYLGLHIHPEVIEATVKAVQDNGVGVTGTRNISGSSEMVEELEAKITNYCGKEAGVLFQSAWVANYSLKKIIDTLEDAEVYSDGENHNSIILPLLSSKAKKNNTIFKYKHNDIGELEELLAMNEGNNVPKIIVFEDVYSMSGERADIAMYVVLAKKYGALLFCDLTHSFGLYDDMTRFFEVDIICGTFGKAAGGQGGFVATNNLLAKLCRRSDGYIFSTANSYAAMAASSKALDILFSEEGNKLRASHKKIVDATRVKLIEKKTADEHFSTIKNLQKNSTHILPYIIGDEFECKKVSEKLFDDGIYLQPIYYPTVGRNSARLRITPSALHTEEMLEDFISKI